MRAFALVLGCAAALMSPFAALAFDTPEEAIEALYAPYLADELPPDREPYFSEHLNGLFAEDAREAGGEVGSIDFDPVIAGQDYQISDFDLDDVSVDGDTALVSVFFKNMGETQSLLFDMVLEDDGWKVDDITSLPPGPEWQLSEIFAEAGIEAE